MVVAYLGAGISPAHVREHRLGKSNGQLGRESQPRDEHAGAVTGAKEFYKICAEPVRN